MSDELVSVIITTYYKDDELRRAIENAVSQTHDRLEIIVVDDSGESYAKNIVSEFNDVKYLAHDRNKGQIEAWHTGFDTAKGNFIQLHDDDDWLESSKIENQLQELNRNNDVGVVFSNIREDDGDIIEPSYDMNNDFRKQVLGHNSYPCQTTSMLIESSILENVFPLNYYPAGTDIALQIELTYWTEFCHVDDVLINRDTEGDSQGSSVEAYRSHLQMMNDYDCAYEEYPEDWISEVTADRYRKLGLAHLRKQFWSLSAIICFSKALYLHTGIHSRYLQLLFASLLGKLGLYMGRIMKSALEK